MKEYDRIVDELMERKDREDIMGYFLYRYAREVPGAAESLLSKIADIAQGEISRIGKVSRKHSAAAFWAVCQQHCDKSDKRFLFATMVPVVMSQFPRGKTTTACIAHAKYWNEFAELLRDKEVFDPEDENDKHWAESNGYTEYLRMALSQVEKEEEEHEAE